MKFSKKEILIAIGVLVIVILGLSFATIKGNINKLDEEYANLKTYEQTLQKQNTLDDLNTQYEKYNTQYNDFHNEIIQVKEKKITALLYKGHIDKLNKDAKELNKEINKIYVKQGLIVFKDDVIKSIQNGFKTFYSTAKQVISALEFTDLIQSILPEDLQAYFNLN